MEQYEQIWEEAKTVLEGDETVSAVAFRTWIKTLVAVDIHENKLVLQTDSRIFADRIRDRYQSSIVSAVNKVAPLLDGVELLLQGEEGDYLNGAAAQNEALKSMELNPLFTFDRFVVGNSNKFVHAAALAVAENPGEAYNPLFIHGGTGLGKTHIMQAVGNYILKEHPNLKVIYVTGEFFTNELIASIKAGGKGGAEFRNKYRNVDVFIIDDIQFIAGKPSTQEEFFYTFNELYNQNKQIIISSDRHPSEIRLLDDRLRTRFEGGLVADVQPPDLETKIAILQKKAAEEKYVLSNDVLELIAGDTVDIRTLQGRLKNVIFMSKLDNEPITPEFARKAMRESSETRREVMTTDTIIDAVCNYYHIARADLLGKKRNKELVDPRQICMYLCTELMNLPLLAIGQAIGGRDHTTVMHARDKIAEQLPVSERLSTEVDDLRNLILKK